MENKAFAKVLDAQDFSTGGGSASALAGAMAAALTGMVARLSKNKDCGLTPEQYSEIAEQADRLKSALLEGAQQDIAAFALVKEGFALPKTTASEKEIRAAKIKQGFITAAQVPGENARLSRQVLNYAKQLIGHSNPGAASDLEVAIKLAETALQGCLANVEINLPSIKDQNVVENLKILISDLQETL